MIQEIHRRDSVIKYSRFKYRDTTMDYFIYRSMKTRMCCAQRNRVFDDNFERTGESYSARVTQRFKKEYLTSRAFFLNQPSLEPSIIPRTMYDIGVINRTKEV